MLRLHLKMEVLKRFGTQARAAQEMELSELRLSQIITGRVFPRESEIATLKKHLNLVEDYQVQHVLEVDPSMSS